MTPSTQDGQRGSFLGLVTGEPRETETLMRGSEAGRQKSISQDNSLAAQPTIGHVNVVEQRATALPAPKARATCGGQDTEPGTIAGAVQQETVEIKLARACVTLREERANQQNAKPISARELARPA